MFFAIAALLIQPISPPLSVNIEKAALIATVRAETSNAAPAPESVAVAVAGTGTTEQPVTEGNVSSLPDAPVPAVDTSAPLALVLARPVKPMTVSVDQLLIENRRNQRLWMGLALASHSAATFDAWSTRRAIGRGAQELNPMLKPFAGNASLYLAIQVGPALMDYAGKKMMYSRHGFIRRMWWIPQSASFVTSIFCGAHNLGVR